MDLTERMNDFRLASRGLYNQFFYSRDREQAIEAEERHSNILEHLFEYMVLQPENIRGTEYFEVNDQIIVSFKPRTSGHYVIEVEATSGNWSLERIPCSKGSPKMHFQYYFDWDELGIKDNKYVKGTLFSCAGAEHLVGKECHFETSDVVFHKA
jgi:hypothetical protein